VSHERKLKSYAAEAAFYSSCCGRVLKSGGNDAAAAAVAEALLVDVSPPTHFLFVLRDLRVAFPQHRYTLDEQVSRAERVCSAAAAAVSGTGSATALGVVVIVGALQALGVVVIVGALQPWHNQFQPPFKPWIVPQASGYTDLGNTPT
jgi:hypothetical protein